VVVVAVDFADLVAFAAFVAFALLFAFESFLFFAALFVAVATLVAFALRVASVARHAFAALAGPAAVDSGPSRHRGRESPGERYQTPLLVRGRASRTFH
jgi:hypothetical protein